MWGLGLGFRVRDLLVLSTQCMNGAQEGVATKMPLSLPTSLLCDQTEWPYLDPHLRQSALPQPTGAFVPNSQTLYARLQSYQD